MSEPSRRARRFLSGADVLKVLPAEMELKKLIAMDGGLRLVQGAFARVICERYYQSYAKVTEATERTRNPCCLRLLGKRCRQHTIGFCEDHAPPGSDHATMWYRGREPYSYTFHPYSLSDHPSSLYFRRDESIDAFCDRLGLRYRIEPGWSWYFPGQTALVELRPRKQIPGSKSKASGDALEPSEAP